MENSLLIAGFGGQGVVLIGQLLGYAATKVNKNATYYAAYGAEQRGGTANSTVIISDEEIGAPVVASLDAVIVMNEPSLVRFESWVKSGGKIIINSSLIEAKLKRDDITAVYIPANEIAEKLGSDKVANMVLLGCYQEVTQILPQDVLIETMKEKLASKAKFLPLNEAAIKQGADFVRNKGN